MAIRQYTTKSDYHESTLTEEDVKQLDITQSPDGSYHFISDNQSYKSHLIAFDKNQKTVTLAINGNTHTIHIQDEYDLLIEKMGLSAGGDQKIGDINAPMPGLILDVLVEVGQEIAKGDGLFILEAMKMENVIKASGDGVVKSISVSKSDAVEKGQLIIEME